MANVVFLAALVASITGCGVGSSRDDLALKVLYPAGGKGDFSFADSVARAVTFARWQFTLELEEIEPATAIEAAQALTRVLATPLDDTLVVAVGHDYQAALTARQCDFNGATVLFLDGELPRCDRLRSVMYDTFAPSFLAGVAAMEKIRLVNAEREAMGQQALSLRAAAFGGADIAPVREFIDGFAAGVAYAGGELTPTEYLADDSSGFADEAGAYALTRRLLTSARVVFPVAGRASRGAALAAQDANAETGERHFVIGVDADVSVLVPDVVLGSVLKRLDNSTREAMFNFANRTFEAGAVHEGVEQNFTEFFLNFLHDEDVDPDDPAMHFALASSVRAASDAARTAQANYSQSLN